jgi:C_GCAxxG_C_C family probable redox protein
MENQPVTKSDIAVDKFNEGYNCAQSVLYSFAQELNIGADLALRIATGFGGGMGKKQEVCGAISGAIMVLNLMYGRGEHDEKAKQETAYAKVRELIDLFTKEFGTIRCWELLPGCALQSEEGQKQFRDNRLIEKCREYVRQAARMVEEITAGEG